MPRFKDGAKVPRHSQTVNIPVPLLQEMDSVRYAEADEHGVVLTRAEWLMAIARDAIAKHKRKKG